MVLEHLQTAAERDMTKSGSVVRDGNDRDFPWALVEQRTPRQLCLVPLLDFGGVFHECIGTSDDAAPLTIGPIGPELAIDHVWGAVNADVARVDVTAPGQRTRRVRPIVIKGSHIRRVFIATLAPALRMRGSQSTDILQSSAEFEPGPVLVRAFDASGRQLAAYAIGKAGCPVPPGCPA